MLYLKENFGLYMAPCCFNGYNLKCALICSPGVQLLSQTLARSSQCSTVSVNMEFVAIEPLPLGEMQAWVPVSLWSQHFINWSMDNRVLLVFLLKMPYFQYIDQLTLNS